MAFFEILNMHLFMTINFTLGYLPKRIKIHVHKISCSRMFVSASFQIAPNYNNPIAFNKKINKLWYFYTMEIIFNNLKSELLMHTTAWINHETC